MLNVLRDSFKNAPYLRIVLALVAVSMVAYLGKSCQTASSRSSADWAARVNGTEIPLQRFINAARNMDDYYRQLFGEGYEQVRGSLKIGAMAIESLIEQELVLQDASRLGLRSSKRELADQIRTTPGFLDSSGQFIGATRYRQLVERQVSGGVAAFERDLGNGMINAKWTSLVTQPVAVTDDELREIFRQRTEKAAIDYLVFETSAQSPSKAIEDSELRSWYETHDDDYRRQDGFKIRYVIVDRETQRRKAQVSDDEIREYYAANQTRYEHPEQRRASHILFRLEPDASAGERATARRRAEETLERIRNGEDLSSLARTLSADSFSAEKGGDLGFVGRGEMVGPFEEAVWATAVGELAPVTETPFGFHVIRVNDRRDAGVTPLDQVEDSIRSALELQAAQKLVQTEAERLRAEIGNAAGLAPVAERLGLAVTARTVTRDDRLADLGAAGDFVPTVAATAPGEITAPLRIAAGVALVAVDDLVPADVAPLDEVRDEVTAAILAERSRQAALVAAERAHARHASVAAAAKALGMESKSSGDLAPGQALPGGGGPLPEFESRLFGEAAAVGARGVLPVPAGALFYEITSRKPFDPARFDEEKASLRQEVLQERRAQYRRAIVDRLRASQKIEINYDLLQQFKS